MNAIGLLVLIMILTVALSYLKNKAKYSDKKTKYRSKKPEEYKIQQEQIKKFEKQMFGIKKDKIDSSKINSDDQKKRYANQQKDNKEKGDNYERFLVDHFRNLGYITVENGLTHGKEDRGIDIILRKDKENLFIQAKNWKADGRRIDHTMIKSFIGEVAFYIEDNPIFGLSDVKRYYITSNDILDNSAKNFIKAHQEKIEYFVIPMP